MSGRSGTGRAYPGVRPDVHLQPVVLAEAFLAVGAVIGPLAWEGRKASRQKSEPEPWAPAARDPAPRATGAPTLLRAGTEPGARPARRRQRLAGSRLAACSFPHWTQTNPPAFRVRYKALL